jgi:hypothetical protein
MLVIVRIFALASKSKRVMKSSIVACIVLIITWLPSFGATYYTAATGDISGAIWSTTTNGTPGVLPTLVSGDIIYIDDDIRVDANFNDWGSVNISIYLNATIRFGNGGQLHLGDASTIVFQTSSARVIAEAGGSSNKINFGGGGSEWDGSNPDLTGPGSLDTNSNGTLPVSISHFSANQSEAVITLVWSTSMQKNFSRFIVERSRNGRLFFEIGIVAASAPDVHNIETEYSFTDTDPLIGFNYYRLKAIDIDETFEIFQPVVVKYAGQKHLSVHPNPSQGNEVNVGLNFQPNEDGQITVVNQYGVEVYRASAADSDLRLSFERHLSPGMYLVKYASSDFSSTTRILVK